MQHPYIYKMVMVDEKDIQTDVYNTLLQANIIVETDYGTTEIMADTIVDLDCQDKKQCDLYNVTQKALGKGIVELLEKHKIDFVLIV